jgi:hypothetical protein
MKNLLKNTVEKLTENLFGEENEFEKIEIDALRLNNKLYNNFVSATYNDYYMRSD